MNRKSGRILTLALYASVCAGTLFAETYEEICQAINVTATKQMLVQDATRERDAKLARDFAKGTYDTAAMKQTRAKIEQLQDELLAAQRTLKQQFEELPELQAEVKKSKESMAEIRALDAQRRELLNKRDAFLQKSGKVQE